jgi:hypothetical protein
LLPIRVPRSTPAAIVLLERFAALEGMIGAVEAARSAAIGQANVSADQEAEPLLAEREAVREKLAAWWPGAAGQLTTGARKTVELGGCMIGTRRVRVSLAVASDELLVVAVLLKRKWAVGLVRLKATLDRAAILKALDGARRGELRRLGFAKSEPDEQFILERVEQPGTRG